MASVTITVPDALVPRLRDMMRANFPEYEELSDADAFISVTADYWRHMLAQYEQAETAKALKIQADLAAEAAYQKALVDGSGIG